MKPSKRVCRWVYDKEKSDEWGSDVFSTDCGMERMKLVGQKTCSDCRKLIKEVRGA